MNKYNLMHQVHVLSAIRKVFFDTITGQKLAFLPSMLLKRWSNKDLIEKLLHVFQMFHNELKVSKTSWKYSSVEIVIPDSKFFFFF